MLYLFNPLKSLLPTCAQVIWLKLIAKVVKNIGTTKKFLKNSEIMGEKENKRNRDPSLYLTLLSS